MKKNNCEKRMDSRPVVVRTDASADDFWSRVRESSDVSPDFKLNRTESFAERVQRTTPFGQQVYPRGMQRTVHVLPPVRSSRSIERIVLHKAIGDADKENADKADEDLAVVISKLHAENAILRANFNRVLGINHALTRNMLTDNGP